MGALLSALQKEKVRFQIVGMTAAILQGAPGVTLDADLWLDLPERQYMRPINIALRLGASMVRQTVVSLTIRSKTVADRDKARAVLPLLRDIAACRKRLRIRR